MISVIIPSWREGWRLLEAVHAGRAAISEAEFIVVACEEPDSIRESARRDNVVWVDAPRACRGLQLGMGAERARGDIFVFLHADTSMPSGAGRVVEETLARKGVAGGAFRLRFDARHPVLDNVARLSAMTMKASFLGDQCLFCSRSAYRAAGGFRALPLLEDVDFVMRLARIGRVVRLRASVVTSGRRFIRNGPLRQLGVNAALLLAYYAGVSIERLSAIYRGHAAR